MVFIREFHTCNFCIVYFLTLYYFEKILMINIGARQSQHVSFNIFLEKGGSLLQPVKKIMIAISIEKGEKSKILDIKAN